MTILQEEDNIERLKEMLSSDTGDTEQKLQDAREFMSAVKKMIQVCGDDPEREGLQETPFRIMKKFLEYTEGYKEDPREHLKKTFDVAHNDLVMVKDIEFDSVCEHHFAPIYGVVHVGYMPNEKVTGLSKIARMADGYAKRFQIQEKLTNQIVDAMHEVIEPQGAMVVVEAKHICMCGRGVNKKDSSTVTTASRGIFSDSYEKRKEFYDLLNRSNN